MRNNAEKSLLSQQTDYSVKLQIMAGVYDEAERTAETQAAQLPSDVF